MAYYRIKCVYCGHTMRSGQVVFKIADEEISDENVWTDNNRQGQEEVELDLGENQYNRDNGYYQVHQDIYMNMGELYAIAQKDDRVKIEPVVAKGIKVSKANQPGIFETYPEDLMTGVKVRNLTVNDHTYRDGIIKRRRCPICHNLLSAYSGLMPTATVGILGHSSAGKTVYFTVLYNVLRQTFRVTGGTVGSEVDNSHLELGSKQDLLKGFAADLGKKRLLPPTTQNALNNPHSRIFTYRTDGSQEFTNRCLFSVRDVMGELIGGTHRDERDRGRDQIMSYCDSADALILAADPLAMQLACVTLDEDARQGQNAGFEELDLMRTQILSGLAKGRMIQKPSVVMLTKTDILFKYKRQLRIQETEPVIALSRWNSDNLYEGFLKPANQSTRACINYLEGGNAGGAVGFSQFLEQTFGNAMFIPVSNTGYRSRIVQHNGRDYVEGPLEPRNVALPILYLLMSMHILPPDHLPAPAAKGKGFFPWGQKEKEPTPFEVWYSDYAQNPQAQEQMPGHGKADRKLRR